MYGTPYIFHFVHPLVKTAEIMVQRFNFERNLKNIRPPTVPKTKIKDMIMKEDPDEITICVFIHERLST